MSLKIMTIVGTRPEIIKLSRIIIELDKAFQHILVHTGQNYDYELNEIFFKDLLIPKPNYFLEAAKSNPAETIANVIARSDEVMGKEKPDAILVYGDTNSCLSVISAKRRKIPIFHMEAGNRCFDQQVPEEINRKIVDHLSDLNMVHCEHARKYLEREGIRPETIIKTGTPMREVLGYFRPQIQSSQILSTLDLIPNQYFVLSTHREENVDNQRKLTQLLESLNFLADKYQKKIITSTHPRTRKKLEDLRNSTKIEIHPLIHFLNPLGFFDYIKLQENSMCVLSDSGTITEEASILNFKAIMIRESHERPEGMDVGAVIMSGLSKDGIIQSVQLSINQSLASKENHHIPDYSSNNVSQQVIKIIQSYTEYINRNTWKKFL